MRIRSALVAMASRCGLRSTLVPSCNPWPKLAVLFLALGLSGPASEPARAQQVVTAPSMDLQQESRFGTAMVPIQDVNGDDTQDLLVGAPRQAVHAQGRDGDGAVFVVGGSEGKVLTSVSSRSTNAVVGGHFGHALARTGSDGRVRAVVGAPGEPVRETSGAGRAYLVRVRSAGRVFAQQVGSVSSSNPTEEGHFGRSLTGLSGDGDIDFVVGAPGETVGDTTGAGRIYGFRGTTEAWSLSSPHPAAEGHFGHALATIGDLNQDGVSDLIVGAPGEFPPADHRPDRLAPDGRAYLVSGADGTVLDTLDSPPAAKWGHFGSAVAAGPDVNGDGTPDAIIGAPTAAVAGTRRVGQAVLLSGADRASIATLSPNEARRGTAFGDDLTIVEEGAGPSSARLVVGAPGAGRVHLFDTDGTHERALPTPDATGRDPGQFGGSLVDAELDGDGRSDLIVGAKTGSPTDNLGTTISEAGQVFVYRTVQGEPANTPTDSSTNSAGQPFAPPEAPEGFSALHANWPNAQIGIIHPDTWTAVNLAEKAQLPVIDLSRKKGTARKRWAGGSRTNNGDPRPIRLFGPDNASVFILEQGLMGGQSTSSGPRSLIDMSRQKARLREPTVAQAAKDTTIAGFDAAVAEVRGTSRDGYDVRYEVIALQTDETLLGVKVLRPVNSDVLSDQTLHTMLDHLRVGPPEGSE